MKTRKLRLLSFLLALAMLFALTPTAAFAADEKTYTYQWGNDHSVIFKYTLDSENNATITGFEGSLPEDGVVEIPDQIAGKPVTTIGSEVFENNRDITKVTIPASVTKIDGNITVSAFWGCVKLKTVVLAKDSQLQNIGNNAFYCCTALESINLEAATKLESIGSSAFLGVALTELTLPASVKTIGYDAFLPTRDGQGGKLKSVTLQDGSRLQSIGAGAFESCGELQSFDFAKATNLQSIAELAFSKTALTTVTIPASVKAIRANQSFGEYHFGEYNFGAFKDCSNLQTVIFEPGSELTTLDDNVFDGCTNLRTIYYDGDNSSVIKELSDLKTTDGKDIWTSWLVTFETAGGSEIEQQNVKNGQKATKPENAPTKAGYTFGGWYADKALITAFDFTAPITADTTLYAKWLLNSTPLVPATPVTYKVTVENGTARVLDENGDELVKEGESVTVQVGKTVTIKATDFSDSNMKFDRWEVRKGEVKLANDHAAETTFTMPAGDVELEAMPVTADTDDSSWDTATVVTGVVLGTGTAVLAYHIGMEVYAEQVLGKGVAVPKTRAEVALLAWQLAGKPEVAVEGEPLSEAAMAQKWAVESGLMANQKDGTFHPEKKMSKLKALRVLEKAKKM